jgi:hypothetical protein
VGTAANDARSLARERRPGCGFLRRFSHRPIPPRSTSRARLLVHCALGAGGRPPLCLDGARLAPRLHRRRADARAALHAACLPPAPRLGARPGSKRADDARRVRMVMLTSLRRQTRE